LTEVSENAQEDSAKRLMTRIKTIRNELEHMASQHHVQSEAMKNEGLYEPSMIEKVNMEASGE
jgi:hypothetical protein